MGCALASYSSSAQERPAAAVRVDTVSQREMADTVSVVGQLVALRAGTLAARVGGPVAAFRVGVGEHVEAGQVLAVLDKASLEVHRDLAESRVAQARAVLATLREQVALARQETERLERLRPSAATSEALYEDAKRREAVARSRVAEGEAALGTARAELELAELRLGYADIRAPYPGVVLERLTEVGSYVQEGQAVARLQSDVALEVEAAVPFRRLRGLAPGTRVEVVLDDGTRHAATVRAVLPEESLLTRTRLVRFVPEFGTTVNPLAAGQTVTVEVPAGLRREALSVHKDAVVKRGEQDLVYVVVDGKAEPRTVRLGEAVGARFEVLEGLQEGEQVVTRGNERLRPGDTVRINPGS
ncbi:MAG: efflux RND transporter periplasmic adaptor subunit [Gammaproteobacteria bacterium]|nr:efflux RND transporter periplasmic adaptor subunit [Gammaproteobacteria bacterium]